MVPKEHLVSCSSHIWDIHYKTDKETYKIGSERKCGRIPESFWVEIFPTSMREMPPPTCLGLKWRFYLYLQLRQQLLRAGRRQLKAKVAFVHSTPHPTPPSTATSCHFSLWHFLLPSLGGLWVEFLLASEISWVEELSNCGVLIRIDNRSKYHFQAQNSRDVPRWC